MSQDSLSAAVVIVPITNILLENRKGQVFDNLDLLSYHHAGIKLAQNFREK